MVTKAELAETLSKNLPAGEFTPYWRFANGSLTVYFEGESDYSAPLADGITVYRALDDNRVVGCRIDGIRENGTIAGVG